jgi:uncharacterized protein YheU (UPF0270 family)
MKKTYVFYGEKFLTKTALIDRIKGILRSYEAGEHLNSPDYYFMCDLLDPEAEQKIGVGVSSIFVDKAGIYNTKCFHVLRQDGTKTDFSYSECLGETDHNTKVKHAFRFSVDPYIFAFKKQSFGNSEQICCPDTGEVLSFLTTHVDHVSPKTFDNLINEFITFDKTTLGDITISQNEDNQVGDLLENKVLERRWIDFHNANACLELVSHVSNLSIRKRTAQND